MSNEIVFSGYRPGCLAAILDLHMDYYASAWNFGAAFEAKVAGEFAEFLMLHDSRKDLFLSAWSGDELVGSIIIDRSVTGGEGAHLRWFITSADVRGSGLGRELMRQAMAFCDERKYDPVWLTTFAGLEAARHLYDFFGFSLTAETAADQWYGGVREQHFERRTAGGE